jgi:hypothetical protein
MYKGDISNALTKRLLVHLDVVVKDTPEVKKKLLVIPTVVHNLEYNSAALSRFYLYTSRAEITLELISTSNVSEEVQELINYLDNVGTNPFRYYTAYDSVEHLVAELPYRPEVVGVVDLPNRLLRYGHWGLTFSDLFGGGN